MDSKQGLYIKLGLGAGALAMTYVLAAVVVPRAMVTFTKAAPATTVSLAESKAIGQKILCKADDTDKCIVNVFILDANSKGVAAKQVGLSGEANISPQNALTDSNGKASFSITSSTEGTIELTPEVGGMPLSKTIKVTFRN